jgi:hypothetical protein
MKAARTTLHRQFSWNVRFLPPGFLLLGCGLILYHSDMPPGRSRAHLTLRLLCELFELAFGSPAPKRAARLRRYTAWCHELSLGSKDGHQWPA